SPDGARWRLALCRARRRRQGGEARGQRRAGGDQDAAPTEMGKHPRLAAAVLGLPTSSRQRAVLRIDHCLDWRSSLLIVALKGISNDHVSLPAVSCISRSRSTPVRCARLAIRDRVDHAATRGVSASRYSIGPRRRAAPTPRRLPAANSINHPPPCAALVFPVTQLIALAFAFPSHAAPRPRSADWSNRLWQRTARAPWASCRPCAPAPDRCAPARRLCSACRHPR